MDLKYFIFLFTIAVCVIAEPGSDSGFFSKFFHHKKKSNEAYNNLTTSVPNITATSSPLEYKGVTNSAKPIPVYLDNDETLEINPIFDNKGQNCLQVAEGLNLSTFLKHLKNVELTNLLTGKDPMTIFAPSNNAFKRMDFRAHNLFGKDKVYVKMVMNNILTKGKVIKTTEMTNEQLITTLNETRKIRINIYPNEKARNKTLIYTANGAKIVKSDILGSNCVFHIVKSVTLKFPDANILDTLSKISKFKTFYEIIKKHADISKLLSGEGPYTVFAPIEQAFTKNSAKDSISSDDMLKIHIVKGSFYTPDFLNEPELLSLQGTKLPVKYKKSVMSDMMLIFNSTLFETDIPVTNGVIHAVNKVLTL